LSVLLTTRRAVVNLYAKGKYPCKLSVFNQNGGNKSDKMTFQELIPLSAAMPKLASRSAISLLV